MFKQFLCGFAFVCLATIVLNHVDCNPTPATPMANPPVIEPIIDWGKCPQLAPTEQQRKSKTDIIKTCLEQNPLNATQDQLNAEIVEKHRIKLGECALKKEDWVSLTNASDSIEGIMQINQLFNQ